MARQRSPIQRLIDNLQRKIRHLNTKEKQANAEGNKFDAAGYQRNKDNIRNLIEHIRKDKNKGKLDAKKLNEYAEEAKNNPNYSADKKKIRNITKKLIMSEPDYEAQSAFNDLMNDEDFADLFIQYNELSHKYIGASGNLVLRNQAINIIEKINVIAENKSREISPHQLELLNNLTISLESALNSRGKQGVLYAIY